MRDNKRMAEGMEKRRLAKGNLTRRNRGRALNRVTGIPTATSKATYQLNKSQIFFQKQNLKRLPSKP